MPPFFHSFYLSRLFFYSAFCLPILCVFICIYSVFMSHSLSVFVCDVVFIYFSSFVHTLGLFVVGCSVLSLFYSIQRLICIKWHSAAYFRNVLLLLMLLSWLIKLTQRYHTIEFGAILVYSFFFFFLVICLDVAVDAATAVATLFTYWSLSLVMCLAFA